MNVLLVNPPLYDFAAMDLWSKPLGLLSIGAALRALGCRVDLLDYLDVRRFGALDTQAGMRPPAAQRYGTSQYMKQPVDPRVSGPLPDRPYFRYGLSREHVNELLNALPSPDLILVTSTFTYTYPGALEAVALLRTRYRRTPVWLGGLYAQLCTTHARRHSGATRVVAETDIAAIAGDVAECLGIDAAAARNWHCYADVPLPAYDLYPSLAYLPWRLSRGCPYRCSYCVCPALYGQREERHVDVAVAHLHAALQHFGVTDVAFYDDALLVNAQKHLLPVLTLLAGWEVPVRFHTPNGLHVHLMNEEIAEALRASGFATVRFGLETLNRARLRTTGAKYDEGDIERALTALCRAGFTHEQVGMYILMGLPGQTPDEVGATIEAVRQRHGVRAQLAAYAPVPGTGLWEAACRESPVDLRAEPFWHNNTLLSARNGQFNEDVIRALRAQAAGG